VGIRFLPNWFAGVDHPAPGSRRARKKSEPLFFKVGTMIETGAKRVLAEREAASFILSASRWVDRRHLRP
jgi:hypothetical protein